MLWWFVILAVSTGAVLWAGIAFYLRVRRHMKPEASKEAAEEVEHEREPGGK
jgi:putative exporter of polyketide antibiotics